MSKMEIEGTEMLERTVKKFGTSGYIGVPKSWVDCPVIVIKQEAK